MAITPVRTNYLIGGEIEYTCKPTSIPLVNTLEITQTIKVYELIIRNPTAASITILVTDDDGTPNVILPTQFVYAQNDITVKSQMGILFTSGFRWIAGGAGLTGQLTYKIGTTGTF